MDVSFIKKLTTAIYLVFLQSDAFPVGDAGGKGGRGSKSGAGAGEWRARRGLVLGQTVSEVAHELVAIGHRQGASAVILGKEEGVIE